MMTGLEVDQVFRVGDLADQKRGAERAKARADYSMPNVSDKC
jgi:hypothetical protein